MPGIKPGTAACEAVTLNCYYYYYYYYLLYNTNRSNRLFNNTIPILFPRAATSLIDLRYHLLVFPTASFHPLPPAYSEIHLLSVAYKKTKLYFFINVNEIYFLMKGTHKHTET